MARHKLIERRLGSLGPGWHGDGDGLWFRVFPDGGRFWIFVKITAGIRREMGLGSFTGIAPVSLAVARQKADAVRAILAAGGDPFKDLPERKAATKQRTFEEVANEFLVMKTAELGNLKHRQQWRNTLMVDAKALSRRPVAEITTDDVARVLRPIWLTKHETATRLRGRIEKVLDHAKVLGLRAGDNPARWKGHLEHVLSAQKKLTRGHHAAMPFADLPAFMPKLRAAKGLGAKALELTILNASRTSEVIFGRWEEVDLAAGLWTVPAMRMKARQSHVVPLSQRALAILRELQVTRSSDLIFPGNKPGKPISNMTMDKVLRTLGGGDYTVHGMRSAFRDWAGDRTSFPQDVIEFALAHKVGSAVEQAYRRASAVEKRRKLMTAWEQFLASPAGTGTNNVVAIRTSSAK